MNTRRHQWLLAGALLAVTALAGAAARGTGRGIVVKPENGAAHYASSAGGPVRFSGTLDRKSVLLGGDGTVRMELVIAGAPQGEMRAERRATDLVIVLDRSGSMMGEKMVHARAAIRELIGQLNPQDRLALVTYSDGAEVAIPLSTADEQARSAWLARVAGIETTGSTNMSSGLDLGLGLVEQGRLSGRVPHLILISDGLANQGDATQEGLTSRARRAAAGEYMLSTVGVGADFNEYLMTALADAGTGNYYYVSDPRVLGDVFAREFDAARTTVASGLEVQIDPASGVRVLDAAGYPLEPSGDGVMFRPGSLFAGQERRIWVTLGIPQTAVGELDVGRFSLVYNEDAEVGGPVRLSFSETPRIACVKNEDEYFAGIDADTWGRSTVVEGYNQMQEDVARAVKEGNREKAMKRVESFRRDAAAMNARVQSAPVARQLGLADELEADVSAAFVGSGQEQRQNELSKAASADAKDARRAGSKK